MSDDEDFMQESDEEQCAFSDVRLRLRSLTVILGMTSSTKMTMTMKLAM